MRFRLDMSCDNAAFGNTPQERGYEVACLLRATAEQVLRHEYEGRLIMDENGNQVGEWSFDDEEPTPAIDRGTVPARDDYRGMGSNRGLR